MTNKTVNVFGYISGDYLYRHNLDHFRSEYGGRDFCPDITDCDQKADIVPRHVARFKKFLDIQKHEIKSVTHGGGGKNSQEGFNRLNVPHFYIDTCIRPEFVPTLTGENSYFCGMCQPGLSLVIPTTQNGAAGTFILKSGRGDIGKSLSPAFTEEVNRLLDQGGDALVSSISSEPLAILVAENKKRGDLYTVITTYLPRDSQGLNGMLKAARANIFSVKEFYWALGDKQRYGQLSAEPFTKEKAEAIALDMNAFANEKGIVGSLMVTLGQHGALHYYRNNGKSKSWVHLEDNVRKDIQDFLRRNNKDTKSAGDKFTASAINALRQQKSLEEAIMDGSIFAIKNVLGYNEVDQNNFQVEYLR